jgi:hypothetical protein
MSKMCKVQVSEITVMTETLNEATQRTDGLVSEKGRLNLHNTGNNERSGGKKNLPNFGEASFVLDEHVG